MLNTRSSDFANIQLKEGIGGGEKGAGEEEVITNKGLCCKAKNIYEGSAKCSSPD